MYVKLEVCQEQNHAYAFCKVVPVVKKKQKHKVDTCCNKWPRKVHLGEKKLHCPSSC